MEFESLREALKFMFDINSPSSAVTNQYNQPASVKFMFDINSPSSAVMNQYNQPASVEDMKELNMEALVSIADLVGVSDLYLDDQPA